MLAVWQAARGGGGGGWWGGGGGRGRGGGGGVVYNSVQACDTLDHIKLIISFWSTAHMPILEVKLIGTIIKFMNFGGHDLEASICATCF